MHFMSTNLELGALCHYYNDKSPVANMKNQDRKETMTLMVINANKTRQRKLAGKLYSVIHRQIVLHLDKSLVSLARNL